MSDSEFRIENINLNNPFDVQLIGHFLIENGFSFKPKEVEYTVALYSMNEELIATGSISKNILKFVVVAKKFRQSAACSFLVSHLSERILNEHKQIFVYTKPDNSPVFKKLGFTEIESAYPLYTCLELGFYSIKKFCKNLSKYKKKNQTNQIASLVMNCNPFTKGHQFLIEKAAQENEWVYLFVVEEDRSVFPFSVRWHLVKEGTKHLENVILVPGGDYMVSGGLFPTYFLKSENPDEVTHKQAELDVKVFRRYIAPALGIEKRYVGEEPYCNTTRLYNEVMKEILKPDIELIEVPRLYFDHLNNGMPNCVSATKIRQAIQNDRLHEVLAFLPDPTRAFLESKEADPINQKLRKRVLSEATLC